jgi:hypothetical protein
VKIQFTIWQKLFIAAFCFGIAIVGFMVKLPSAFRGHDKEMHTLFYFLAAAFLNILFAKRHVLIFIFLYLFGMGIELSQEYSNHFFKARIHGRYDPEDIRANLKGLLIFSAIWVAYLAAKFVFKKKTVESSHLTS